MFLNLIKRTFKKDLTVFKTRLYALKLSSIVMNIFSLRYNGEDVIETKSHSNHYKCKTRKICIFVILFESFCTLVGGCCLMLFRIYYPKKYLQINRLAPTEYTCRLIFTTSIIKYFITFCALLCWWNKSNQKTLTTLLNELLILCRKLHMRLDIDLSKPPPQCSLLFQLQNLLIIWNLLNNICVVYSFNSLYSTMLDFLSDICCISLYFAYQLVLLTLWQLHYKVNVKFEMRMECETFKYKTVLKYVVFLRNLKNLQPRFATDFVWLPRLVALKTFLIVGQSSYLWHYQNQHNSLADVKLIWLYTNLSQSLLDMFLLVFMLSELCRLDLYTQRLLFEADNRLHNTVSAHNGALKEPEIYLSTPRLKSYTLQLAFTQQICHFKIWAILLPVVCGFIMTCLHPFDMMFMRDLSQFNWY